MEQHNGEMYWNYDFPVREKRNFLSTLKTMAILLGITYAIIIFAMALGSSGKGFFMVLKACSFVFWLIAAIYAVSLALSCLVSGGVFCYSYESDGRVLRIISKAPDESLAGTAGKVLPINQVTEVFYDNVRILRRRRKMNAFEIRGVMTVATVYASDDDYERVWEYLSSRCPEARKK